MRRLKRDSRFVLGRPISCPLPFVIYFQRLADELVGFQIAAVLSRQFCKAEAYKSQRKSASQST